jgi:hypothetical protein
MEKSSWKIWATCLIFEKNRLVNNSPIGRKFARSGHPVTHVGVCTYVQISETKFGCFLVLVFSPLNLEIVSLKPSHFCQLLLTFIVPNYNWIVLHISQLWWFKLLSKNKFIFCELLNFIGFNVVFMYMFSWNIGQYIGWVYENMYLY